MAFAIGIRYVTGYSVAATRPGGQPEWPPHPARVFMAMAAAHFEAPGDSSAASEDLFDDSVQKEREALHSLESLDEQPRVFASDAHARSAVTCYVPINDHPTGKKPGALQCVTGWMRTKQPRTFPRVRPHDDRVFLIWQCDLSEEHRSVLNRLCAKVTRIGHSSSLVQMWVAGADEAPAANWEPNNERPTCQLRRLSRGFWGRLEQQFGAADREQYQLLKADFERLKSEKKAVRGRGSQQRKSELQLHIDELNRELADLTPRDPLRPTVGLWQGYARPEPKVNGELPGTMWDPRLIILRLEPKETCFRRLDLVSTLQVTRRMREAVLRQWHQLVCGCDRWDSRIPTPKEARLCWQQIPEWLSGHKLDGSALGEPHLAYLPLAFVGSQQADGHLMGLAVAMPDGLSRKHRGQAWAAMEQVCRAGLKLGRLGIWQPSMEDRELPPWNLRPDTWTGAERGAAQWASVTPVAFDQHPKARDRAGRHREVAGMIRRGCARIGLPEPREVVVTPVSAHIGVPPSHEFPPLARKDGSVRRHVHAILIFDERVRGSIAVCAGRYRGYGFFRPLREKEAW
jgi:CRISPR-associated protein Csb2